MDNMESIQDQPKSVLETIMTTKETSSDSTADVSAGELIAYTEVDPALAAKMHLVNEVV